MDKPFCCRTKRGSWTAVTAGTDKKACLHKLIRYEQPVIGELVHENTRERRRGQARRKSRIAHASRKRRYQESSTESRVHLGCDGRQGMTTATRHHKRQGNGYGHPNTMRDMKKSAVVGIILAAASLTTPNLLKRLKKHYTCASGMEWNVV